jgi:hypothetical protein
MSRADPRRNPTQPKVEAANGPSQFRLCSDNPCASVVPLLRDLHLYRYNHALRITHQT